MRRFFSPSVAAVLAAGAPVVACSGGDGASSLAMTAIQRASSTTIHGAAPMALVTPGGDRVLSWVADDSATGREALFVEVARAGSAAVEPVSVVRDSLGGIEPHGEAPPRLAAAPDGALYALYTVGKEVPGERFPRSALRLVRSEDRGRTWSDPISVNEGSRFGSHNFHALLAGPRGAVYAAWLSSTRGRSAVWLRRSTDGGRSWLSAQPIDTTEACPCCRTGLALSPDGTLYLSWRKVFTGEIRDVVVIRSSDSGATWDPPARPREDNWVIAACPHAGPSLAVDQTGVVHMAWWTGKSGEAGVYYARSTDGGRHFQPVPIATGDRSAPAHVQVTAGAAGAVVAWDDGLSSTPRILMRASSDGSRFGPIHQVSESGAASFPVLGIIGDSLLIAWSETTDAAHWHGVATKPDMKNPKATMPLPRVGQAQIFERRAALAEVFRAQ